MDDLQFLIGGAILGLIVLYVWVFLQNDPPPPGGRA